MCPKFNDGICEIAGIEPEHVECADRNRCYNNEYEICSLYFVECLMHYKGLLYETV